MNPSKLRLPSLLIAAALAGLLAGCTSTDPANQKSSASASGHAAHSSTAKKKNATSPAKPRSPSTQTAAPAPKPGPTIPLKEETGTSPLIITQPDAKPYVRE